MKEKDREGVGGTLESKHEEFRYQCGECGRKFVRKSTMVQHMNFVHTFEEEDNTKRDLEILRLESSELSKMSLKCLRCPRLFPRRSNWVQHLNYAHRIRIELNTPSAAKRRQAQLEGQERMRQQALQQVTTQTAEGLIKDKLESDIQLDISIKTEDNEESRSSSQQHRISDQSMDEKSQDSTTTETLTNSAKETPAETNNPSLYSNNLPSSQTTKILKTFEASDNSGIMVFSRKDIPPAKLKAHLLKPQKPLSGLQTRVKKRRERVDKNCSMCGQFFKFKNVFEDHILKHSDPKPYKCNECNFQSESRHGLKAHLQIHGIGEKYQCSGCDKMFYNLHRLLKHERTHTKRERAYKCEICGKAFMEEPVLLAHKKCHFKELTACELCGKKLSKKRMKEHMNLHTAETVFPCNLCNTVYKQKRSLEAHLKFKHGDGIDLTEKHVCTMCNQQFANYVTLEKHMLRHNSENKKFTCSQCGQGFYTKAEVCNHEMTHLDPLQRPYVCRICSKTFTKEHSLKAHQLVHNPSKPLNCEQCGKGFRWKNKLKEHMRTHTGERPFKCRYCESMFADCATRRYHEKKYHPDKAILPAVGVKKFSNNEVHAANIQHTGDGRIIISRGSGPNTEYVITDEKDFNQKYGLLTEEADTSGPTYVLSDVKDDDTHHESPHLIKVEDSGLAHSLQNAQLVTVSAVAMDDTTNYIIAESTNTNSTSANNQVTHGLTTDSVATSDETSEFVIDKIEGDTNLIISDDQLNSGGNIEGETRYILTRGSTRDVEDISTAQFIVPDDTEHNFVIAEGSGAYEGERLGGGEEFVVSGDGAKVHLLEEGDGAEMGMFVEGVSQQYIQLVGDDGDQQVQFVVEADENN